MIADICGEGQAELDAEGAGGDVTAAVVAGNGRTTTRKALWSVFADVLVDVRNHFRKAEGVISSRLAALVRERGPRRGVMSPFGIHGSPTPATDNLPDTQSTMGFHLYSQSLPKNNGLERLGTTTT